MAGNRTEFIDLCDSQSPVKRPRFSKEESPELDDWSQIIAQELPQACLMECGCCFGDSDVEQMVQCGDGHLFCCDCLKRYAQEAIHGQGKSQLKCMTADCDALFPRSQMKRALTSELINKFDERVQEESLNLAKLENLVRCPGCSYAAEIVNEQQKVFVCTQCHMRSCRHCQNDWNDHEGLTCEQVEKKDETAIRTKYEEKMTEARVRHCPKCKTPLLKEGGCNKITCRCGGKICYICRAENIEYSHFCQHVGPHNKITGCKQCKSCSLWTDGEADDRRIIEELKAKGQLEKQELGLTDDRAIGAPTDARDAAALVASKQQQPGVLNPNAVPFVPAAVMNPPQNQRAHPPPPVPPPQQRGQTAAIRRKQAKKFEREMTAWRRVCRRIDEEERARIRLDMLIQGGPREQVVMHAAPVRLPAVYQPAVYQPQVFAPPPMPAVMPVAALATDLLTGRGGAVNIRDYQLRLPAQQPDDVFMRGHVRPRAPATATAPQPVAPEPIPPPPKRTVTAARTPKGKQKAATPTTPATPGTPAVKTQKLLTLPQPPKQKAATPATPAAITPKLLTLPPPPPPPPLTINNLRTKEEPPVRITPVSTQGKPIMVTSPAAIIRQTATTNSVACIKANKPVISQPQTSHHNEAVNTASVHRLIEQRATAVPLDNTAGTKRTHEGVVVSNYNNRGFYVDGTKPSSSGVQNLVAKPSTNGNQNLVSTPSTSGTQSLGTDSKKNLSKPIFSDSDDDDLLFHEVLEASKKELEDTNGPVVHAAVPVTRPSICTLPGETHTTTTVRTNGAIIDNLASNRYNNIDALQANLTEWEKIETKAMERDHEQRIDALYTAMEQERLELRRQVAAKQDEINKKRKMVESGGLMPTAGNQNPERFQL